MGEHLYFNTRKTNERIKDKIKNFVDPSSGKLHVPVVVRGEQYRVVQKKKRKRLLHYIHLLCTLYITYRN